MDALRIVNFHGIGLPDRTLDPGEEPYWLSRDRFRSILDRIASHPARASIEVTFDDSNASDLEVAVPELLTRGLVASFFVLTGRFGRQGSLDPGDVRDLLAVGMTIGSHGVDHRDLTRLSPALLAHEVVASKAALEQASLHTISRFAIPFGRYNARVLRSIRAAGHDRVYTSDGGVARSTDFVQPRRSLRSDMDDTDVARILNGHLPPRQSLRRFLSMAVKRHA